MHRLIFALTLPLASSCVSVHDETPPTLSRRADGVYRLSAQVETYGTQASSVTASVGSSEFPMTDVGGGRWEVDAPLDPCVQGFQLRYSVRYQQLSDTAAPATLVEPPGASPTVGGLLKWVTPLPKGLNCGAPSVFRVNAMEFEGDSNRGDGICDANPPGSTTRRCTLRAAIDETNATRGPATIELPPGTYTAPEYFTPTDDLVLVGMEPGVVLSHVSIYGPSGTTPTVELRNLTVRGGVRSQLGSLRLSHVTVHGVRGTIGGGVVALGVLSIESSTIIGNEMAGVRLQGSRGRIRGSLIANNTDGGVYCIPTRSAELEISDSTITGNRGFFGGVGVSPRCRATLRNVTVTGNDRSLASDFFVRGGGGGLSVHPEATVILANTILAGNTNTREPGDLDCGTFGPGGSVQSLGHNLVQNAGSCRLTSALGRPDVLGVAAGLGGLGDNGGPTQTMLPLSGSAARLGGSPDAYNDAFTAACTHHDQRGHARLGACDIGAAQVSR